MKFRDDIWQTFPSNEICERLWLFDWNSKINISWKLMTLDMNCLISRSSHPEVFCKIGVLKSFAKLTGKYLCLSLFFNKVAGWDLQLYLKKTLSHRRFPVNFAKFLKTPSLHNISGGCFWILLQVNNVYFQTNPHVKNPLPVTTKPAFNYTFNVINRNFINALNMFKANNKDTRSSTRDIVPSLHSLAQSQQ